MNIIKSIASKLSDSSMWNDDGIGGKIMVIFSCILIVACFLLVCYLIFIIVRDTINSKKCIVCNDKTTLNRNENGEPVCDDCISIEKAKKNEKVHICLNDSTEMVKQVVERIVVDKCPKCGGVWLDQNEIQKLVDIIENGNSSGHLSGFARGLILGTTM